MPSYSCWRVRFGIIVNGTRVGTYFTHVGLLGSGNDIESPAVSAALVASISNNLPGITQDLGQGSISGAVVIDDFWHASVPTLYV